jgi:sRNA-binding regulator protein Hfq
MSESKHPACLFSRDSGEEKMITIRKSISIVLAYLLIVLIMPFHAGRLYASDNPNQSQDAEQVKSAVAQIGTDPDVHVKVTLRNGTKVKGYISSIGADSFSVTREGTAKTTTISYTDVVKIEKSKATLPGRDSVFWRVLAGIGLVVILVVVYAKSDRPG